jgi:hypothetical protein
LLKPVFDSRAAVFGYDQVYGITAYYLSPEKSILGYVHEGFDCIGSGKYASGLSLGRDFNAKTLMMRKKGYAVAEGLLELISSALVAAEHFKEVGGNMNFVIIDGRGKTHQERYREYTDDVSRLACEVVLCYRAHQLRREQAVDLLGRLVKKGQAVGKIEGMLFARVKNREYVNYLLRRYKLKEIAQVLG